MITSPLKKTFFALLMFILFSGLLFSPSALADTDLPISPIGPEPINPVGQGMEHTIVVSSDTDGIKGFSLDQKPFIPIGVNYFIEGQGQLPSGAPYKTFDMFDTFIFNPKIIDEAMRNISANGFNYVRLWLKGVDTDYGFASSPTGSYDPKRWEAYVRNIAYTIEIAHTYRLHVVLTGSFPGPNTTSTVTGPEGTMLVPKNYLPPASSMPSEQIVGGFNRLILIPEMADALGKFYYNLLNALRQLDPRINEDIFYIDLYCETHYDLSLPPFSSPAGTTFRYGDVDYNMDDFSVDEVPDPHSRQGLMDVAAENFVRIVKNYVEDAMPNVLVTTSMGTNYGSNHFGFDGGANNGKNPNIYMLKPRRLVQGGADIIDVHFYPSPAMPQYKMTATNERAAAVLESNEIYPPGNPSPKIVVNARVVPLIAGEFGAYTQRYGVTASSGSPQFSQQYEAALGPAIKELSLFERDAFSVFRFSGFGVWAWSNETFPNYTLAPPGGVFTLVSPYDPQDRFMKLLAPKYSPEFIGQHITP